MSNENCRSFPSDENSIFPGTNIDTEDFKLTSKFGKESRCSKLKNPNFFKIETKIDSGAVGDDGSYEKWLDEQEIFSELVAKQKKLENNYKIVKKINLNLN